MNREKILELIENSSLLEARKALLELNVVDIAYLFEEIDHKKLPILYRMLPKDISAEVFSYMESELQHYLIESITDEEIIEIMDELFLDDAVDFIEEMPSNVVKRVLRNANENTRKQINQLLNYPEDSAGSLMTTEYVDLKKEMTVGEAIEYVKRDIVDKETIHTCYVVDKNRILEGVISLRNLIIHPDSDRIGDIMDTGLIQLNTLDDQETVASVFKKYDYHVLPVVDNENRLVGIITVDDILDVIDEEATEDIYKMAAMAPSEKEYLKTSNWELAKNRIPWLLILMISATFTGGIIKKFEDALQSVMILAAFIPMIMDTGGNAGSQSSTLVIRALALGELEPADVLKVLWKEICVSSIVGIVLAGVNFIRIYFIEHTDLFVSLTVTLTLVFTVLLAKIVGGVLPIIAKKMKLDPAIMAAPLITTIVDAAALFIYFSLAQHMLSGLL